MKNVTYVEPFAGGAGVSLELLFSGEVDHIVINDYDKAIYSIWRAIIENTNQFVDLKLFLKQHLQYQHLS